MQLSYTVEFQRCANCRFFKDDSLGSGKGKGICYGEPPVIHILQNGQASVRPIVNATDPGCRFFESIPINAPKS